MFAAATQKWYSDPSSMEAKSKEVTPHFVVEALTYEPQCLPRLSTRYKVMGSPSVLDGARHCRPAEVDVKLVHGTWAQVECHLPLLWTSCDILSHNAKEYLLVLCHVKLVT